jgi:hypothetical protein
MLVLRKSGQYSLRARFLPVPLAMDETETRAPRTPSLLDRVRSMLGVGLQEVPGATVSGEIPLAAGVINRLIAAQLAASHTAVVAATLEPHDGDAFTLRLRLRTPRILPTVKVSARIEQQPEFPARPVIGIRWSLPGLGPLALLAGPALARFKSLPPGIRVQGDWITVDLFELLRARGFDELIPYLAGLRLTTLQDRVLIQFRLRS